MDILSVALAITFVVGVVAIIVAIKSMNGVNKLENELKHFRTDVSIDNAAQNKVTTLNQEAFTNSIQTMGSELSTKLGALEQVVNDGLTDASSRLDAIEIEVFKEKKGGKTPKTGRKA